MDYFEVVDRRYSYRGEFLKGEIPEENIRKILMAGIKAPSGYNLQTTLFIVVTEPELINQIAEAVSTPEVKTAPLVIVPISEHVIADDLCFEVEDYGVSSENILLAITALGYASVLMDGSIKEGAGELIEKILNVPSKYTVRAIMPVGVPKEPGKQAQRKTFEERVIRERFNA